MAEVGHNSGNGLVVRLHPADNVVTARLDMLANMSIDDEQVSSKSEIPSGHKIATRLIQSGEEIRKYEFDAGSMGPKVEAACSFIERSGQRAVIGSLTDIEGMVNGTAGTQFMLK